MENASQSTGQWDTVLSDSFQQLAANILSYLPQIISAVALLIGGVIVAWLLSKATYSLLIIIRQMVVRILPAAFREKRFGVSSRQLKLFSKIVFWIVILFFVATSSKIIGLDFFASTISALIVYLPRMLAGAVIIFGGFLLSNVAAAMTKAALDSSGVSSADTLVTFVKIAVIFTTVVVGVEQIGIDMRFVTNLAITLGGVLAAGVALAFGLGCRELIVNVVAARQARKHCQMRIALSVAGIKGTLVDITGTMLVIETETGKILLPAKYFLNGPTEVVSLAAASATREKPESQDQQP